jgi:cytochrome P450
VRDVVVGDLALPAKTSFVVLVRPPTLDPARFDAPDQFRPERWLDASPGQRGPHDARVHMPFGTGPRICPGRALAMLEIRVLLATIASSFDLERAGKPEDVRELFEVTMAPRGLRARVRRRSAS